MELIPGEHIVHGKIYPLNKEEQKELDAFLKENLTSGWIRLFKSPFASPTFFIQKKDRKLQPVQAYWKLNEVVTMRYRLKPWINVSNIYVVIKNKMEIVC